MRPEGLRVCLLFYLICPANIIGLWWAVGSPLLMDPNRICRKSKRVGRQQHHICRKEREIVKEAVNGVHLAILECQFQFRQRRWNCSTAYRGIQKVLKLDSREAGFVHAMTAAGVVWAVTHACTLGSLLQCSCDNTIRDIKDDKHWEWGGCGDDINFGYMKSKEFMDVHRKRKRMDISKMVNLQNNEAGRLAVRKNMGKVCKCHGLSGSCTLKTCWRKMSPLRPVSDNLKVKFDGAAKVTISNDGRNLLPVDESIKPPQEDDIVYTTESPDYCEQSRKRGSLGTVGRLCEPRSMGVGGCDLLCCGRGYRLEEHQIMENCKCQFKWCCEVQCQTCNRTVQVAKCL